ncbi:MAG: alpha/beta hydrolase [Myxococcota bacterium]|nr:alpha/beta hydrolase [Myxococcota bacterium]
MNGLLDIHQRVIRRILIKDGFRSSMSGPHGSQMHSYVLGQGQGHVRYVVLHGLGTHASAFARLLRRLKKTASYILAPDLLGHGFSDTPDKTVTAQETFARLASFLDDNLDEPVVLVGTSLGGAMAMKYALAAPHNVVRLVLISPAGAPMTPDGFAHVRRCFEVKTAADGRAFMARLFHKPPWYRFLIGREITRLLSRGSISSFLAPDADIEPMSSSEVARLKPPTLLLWGQSERLLPIECLHWYRDHMPENVAIETPVGFGHSPHLEIPGKLANRIVRFAIEKI